MTGDVPYYGGRFTPAQAYAASHPRRSAQLKALQQLRDDGVISAAEHDRLASRVTG
jgi:hypothetical protein